MFNILYMSIQYKVQVFKKHLLFYAQVAKRQLSEKKWKIKNQ